MLHRLNCTVSSGHSRLTGEIPQGQVAYVDVACLSGETIEARLFSQGSHTSASAWICLQEAAALLADRFRGQSAIYIEGNGVFAKLLTHIYAENIVEKSKASILIDTTGIGEVIQNLIKGAPRMGIVVLCCHPCDSAVSVDLYAAIHCPGISVVAMDMWNVRKNSLVETEDNAAVMQMLTSPTKIKLGDEVPKDSLWLEIYP